MGNNRGGFQYWALRSHIQHVSLVYFLIAGFNTLKAYEAKHEEKTIRLTRAIQTFDSAPHDPGGNRAVLGTC